MKREKRLTKREKRAIEKPGGGNAAGVARHAHQHRHDDDHKHIHCIACGKHLDADMFGEPSGANYIRCEHGTHFPHCVACEESARKLVEEHDRTGENVKSAAAWH